jgi:hypothetical protein
MLLRQSLKTRANAMELATAPVTPWGDPDSDRAKKPSLSDPVATDQELNPGDRVEGLGDIGRPTGEFGTVEQSNEDDAVVEPQPNSLRPIRQRLHY